MKGEELPGFQEDGEYSERAFESWLREQAILPTQVTPSRIHNEVHTTHRSTRSPVTEGFLAARGAMS